MRRKLRTTNQTSTSYDTSEMIYLFIENCKIRCLSSGTILHYQTRLNSFQKYLNVNPASEVNKNVIQNYLAWELTNNSRTTASHSHTTLSVYFKYLLSESYINNNPIADIKKPRRDLKIIQTFTLEQLQTMISSCGNDFKGIRDKAIFTLLFDTGLRATEFCQLIISDINMQNQTILVRHGKGDKQRMVYFSHFTKKCLMAYLRIRGEHKIENVFTSMYGVALTNNSLNDIIKLKCEELNITDIRASAHKFRHSFAVSYLNNGGDVFSLQKILGHTALDMTRRYVNLTEIDVSAKHKIYSPADKLNFNNINRIKVKI